MSEANDGWHDEYGDGYQDVQHDEQGTTSKKPSATSIAEMLEQAVGGEHEEEGSIDTSTDATPQKDAPTDPAGTSAPAAPPKGPAGRAPPPPATGGSPHRTSVRSSEDEPAATLSLALHFAELLNVEDPLADVQGVDSERRIELLVSMSEMAIARLKLMAIAGENAIALEEIQRARAEPERAEGPASLSTTGITPIEGPRPAAESDRVETPPASAKQEPKRSLFEQLASFFQ